MKNSTLLFLAAIALLIGSILLAGCELEGADDASPEVADADALKTDALSKAAYPSGRFEADPPGSGAFSSLTLRANGAFEAEENVACGKECVAPRLEGKVRFTRAGDKRFVHLVASDGSDVRWAWQKLGDELQLRKPGTAGWSVLAHVAVDRQ